MTTFPQSSRFDLSYEISSELKIQVSQTCRLVTRRDRDIAGQAGRPGGADAVICTKTPAQQALVLALAVNTTPVAAQAQYAGLGLGRIDPLVVVPVAHQFCVVPGLRLVDLSDTFHIKSINVTVDEAETEAVAMVRANGNLTLTHHGGATHRVPNYWRTVWKTEEDTWKLVKVTRLNPVNGTEMGYFSAQ